MKQVFYLNESTFELVNLTIAALGKKYKKFDELRIYENDSLYEIVTINKQEKFITKTIIGKIHWRVKECVCNHNGEEIKLK